MGSVIDYRRDGEFMYGKVVRYLGCVSGGISFGCWACGFVYTPVRLIPLCVTILGTSWRTGSRI